MNFIMFYSDQLRAESISCYGHPLVKMPNYDRVAKEGVLFENCYVQHTVCSPSRCAVMTGQYPHVSGHRTLWHLIRKHESSLFKYLKNAGYHVEWQGKNDLYSQDSFKDCVDNYNIASGSYHGANAFELGTPGYYSFLTKVFDGDVEETNEMQNVRNGIEFLKSRKKDDKPFFLYLPLEMPHPEYAAPEPFHSMYSPNDVPELRPICDKKPDLYSLIRKYRELDKMYESLLKSINAIYLGMNSCVDHILGELLKSLDETGLTEDTTLILTSDHGDWAGDYGLVEKWSSALDDCLTRVPLVIRTPGNKSGHRVKEPMEQLDLMSTVLELAGVEANHTHFSKSLCGQLSGESGDPDRAVFAEGGYDIHEPQCFEGIGPYFEDPKNMYYPKGLQQQEKPESICRSVMIRYNDYKLISRTSGLCELYDMSADPRELNNIYDDPKFSKVQNDLEKKLLKWYIKTADAVPCNEDARGLPGK